jgi:hypothetical protein
MAHPSASFRYSLIGALGASLIYGAVPMAMRQALADFVPVGVRYRPVADVKARQHDLEEMRRLRFNVVSLVQSRGERGGLSFIDRVLAGAPYPRVPTFAGDTPALIQIAREPAEVTLNAWAAVARGARVVIFDDWAALRGNPGALTAAAEFAEAVTRNAPLYAALRPRTAKRGTPDVRIRGGGTDVEATVLESSAALVVVGLNRGSVPHTVTMTFSTELPEAIWQNMMTGSTVSFVTRKEGPTYTRTFAPKDVLVLMINKRLR